VTESRIAGRCFFRISEVLMTQRDALETKLELIETKKEQLNAAVNICKGLGGGWR
jgi:outer membrane protein TolC